jgi:transketolase
MIKAAADPDGKNNRKAGKMKKTEDLRDICRLIRYYILESTTEAGSGHPSSSLSAVELMAVLFFKGFFRFRTDDPGYDNNDRLIFSKGHASPLLYALWAAAGGLDSEDLRGLRDFDSVLEGHPTPRFKYTEAATGSLGQGLSIGLGMALAAKKLDGLSYNTFVLLGDSEMAEGSQWEAIQLAVHYGLDNLVGIIDVNRLGQRGQTMYGTDISAYAERISAFGWETIPVSDGHDLDEVEAAYSRAMNSLDKPAMIIASTKKGKGVSIMEDREGWHGKALDREQYEQAVKELGDINKDLEFKLELPVKKEAEAGKPAALDTSAAYSPGENVSTRRAYGDSLARLADSHPGIVILDAEVSNSTYSDAVKEDHGERFFEMYVAEQNMVGAALGMSLRGKIPFVSTFAAFFTRAFDQIRMSQYSGTNIKFCGSHSGVSIGADGSSQMGLEDISMFRSLLDCVVFYPSDAVSTEAAVRLAAAHKGNVYIRTTRMDTPVIYENMDGLDVGTSRIIRESGRDCLAVIAGGITLYEALKAYEELLDEGISIKIVDIFCIKPIDSGLLKKVSFTVDALITVEDHYGSGGMGEAVSGIEGLACPVYRMAVGKIPRSGKPEELLEYEEISKKAIIKKIKNIIKNKG